MILHINPNKIILQDYMPNAGDEYNSINEVDIEVYDFYEKNTYNWLTYSGSKININDLQLDKVYEVTLTDTTDPVANGKHNLIKHVKFIGFSTNN